MLIKCSDCNKKLKKLRVCVKCGLPVCGSCQINNYCKKCSPLNQDEVLVNAYFRDKYHEEKKNSVQAFNSECELQTCNL